MSRLIQGQLQKYLTFVLVGYFAVSVYGSFGQASQSNSRTAACCESNCSENDSVDIPFTPCILPANFTFPFEKRENQALLFTENFASFEKQKSPNARAPPFFFG